MNRFTLIFLAMVLTTSYVQGFEISVAYQDIAPKYIMSDTGVAGGICVEILSALEAVNPEIHFSEPKFFTPIKRIMYGLQEGSLMAFCGAAFGKERAQKILYSNTPLYSVSTLLAVSKKNSRNYSSINDLKSDLNLRFNSIANTSTHKRLVKSGFNMSNHYLKTVEQGLGIALLNKGDVFAYHSLGLEFAIGKNNKWNGVRLLPISLRNYEHWMVFNKQIRKEHLKAINAGLKELRDKKILEKIVLKYQ